MLDCKYDYFFFVKSGSVKIGFILVRFGPVRFEIFSDVDHVNVNIALGKRKVISK